MALPKKPPAFTRSLKHTGADRDADPIGRRTSAAYVVEMSFLDRLFGPAPSRLPAPDEQLALAALLVRVARADGFASAPELARIAEDLGAQINCEKCQ